MFVAARREAIPLLRIPRDLQFPLSSLWWDDFLQLDSTDFCLRKSQKPQRYFLHGFLGLVTLNGTEYS